MSNTTTTVGPTWVDLLPNDRGIVCENDGQVWVGIYTAEPKDAAPVRLFTAFTADPEGEMETYLTPPEARELAHWLLGAADRAEREGRWEQRA